MIYTVTLNPAIDYVVKLKHLDLGKVNRTQGEEIQFGGKGINVSVMLSRLGVSSCALGFVAGFTGEMLLEVLEKNKIDTDFIRLEKGMTRINVKVKADSETEINAQGPMIEKYHLDELLRRLDCLTQNDILVLAGSVPKSIPNTIYEQMMQRVQNKKVSVVVDTTGEGLCNVLQYHPFLIKPNHVELGEIFGKELSCTEEIRKCAATLQSKGARNVLVSMAGEGAILLDENGIFHQMKAPQGVVKNSVGAGDSMVAGFLTGYLQSGKYSIALQMGTAAGSATAFSDGLATKEDVLSMFRVLKG